MNNNEIAVAFAEGKNNKHSLHMFIDGDTIYSYGYHFPIARRIGARYIIFNSNGYSPTTARHKSRVFNAITGVDKNFIIIEAPECAVENAEAYINSEINKAHSKEYRARLERNREFWSIEAERYAEMLVNLKKIK